MCARRTQSAGEHSGWIRKKSRIQASSRTYLPLASRKLRASRPRKNKRQPNNRRQKPAMNLIRFQNPALTHWPAFGGIAGLHDEIERLFENPLAAFTGASRPGSGWSPAFDVFEAKDNFAVVAELPGVKKDVSASAASAKSKSVSKPPRSVTRNDSSDASNAPSCCLRALLRTKSRRNSRMASSP